MPINDQTSLNKMSAVPGGDELPSQVGNSGKFLTTDGTDPSWGAIGGGGDMLAANNLSDVANAGTSRTNLGVTIGSDVQAYDATLLSIALLGTAADRMAYTTGVDTWAEAVMTAAGRALMDDADAATQRTTLGLGNAATATQGSGNGLDADQLDGLEATAFVRVDGSQALTANWDMGAYTIRGTQFISDIAIGTAPLVVTSTTVVANLNADLLDGNEAAAFALAGHDHDADYQPLDATLTSLAALGTSGVYAYTTGIDTWAEGTITAAGRAILDDANASAQRTTLGLAIGSDVQAYDAELAALAALVSAADRLPYFTGSGAASLATFTAFARTLLDDADAATARATLGANSATNLTTGTVDPARVNVVNRRHQLSFFISGSDVAAGSMFHIPIPWKCTPTRQEGITDTGTATYNIEERSTIGTPGTDLLASDQVADTTGEIDTSFSNTTLAAANYLTIAITSVASSPTQLEIYLEVEIDTDAT